MRTVAVLIALLFAGTASAVLDETITITGNCSVATSGTSHFFDCGAFPAACSCTCAGYPNCTSCTVTGDGNGDGCGAAFDTEDDIIVGSGGTLRPGTLTQAFTQANTTGVGVTVQSGGTANFTIDSSVFTVTLGPRGLDCQAGSTCTWRGKYRQPPGVSATPALSLTRPTGFFSIYEYIPCAGVDGPVTEPDCNALRATTPGNAARALLRWPARVDEASGNDPDNRFIPEMLGALVANDEIVFWDPDPTGDVEVPSDVLAPYQIQSVSVSAAPYDLTINMDQGVGNNSQTLLSRRRLIQTETVAAVSKGVETFCIKSDPAVFPSTDAIDVAHAMTGRFIRFLSPASPDTACDGNAAADGVPCLFSPTPIMIANITPSDLTNCAANQDFVALTRGVTRDLPANSPVLIDYGWSPGDTFFVQTPMRIRCASPGTDAGQVTHCKPRFNGTAHVQAATIRTQGSIVSNAATALTLRDVWHQDNAESASPAITTPPVGAVCDHIVRTGTATTANSSRHGLQVEGTFNGLTCTDLLFRDHSDDTILPANSPGATGSLTVRRLRDERVANRASPMSKSLVDALDATGDNNTTVVVEDVFVATGSLDNDPLVRFVDNVRRILLVGYRASASTVDATQNQFEDFLSIRPVGGANRNYAPGMVTRCLVKNGTGATGLSGLLNNRTDVRDCVYQNLVVNANTGISSLNTGVQTFRNSAFLDVTATQRLFRFNAAFTSGSFLGENLTIAYTPQGQASTTSMHEVIEMNVDVGANKVRFDGLQVTNFKGTEVVDGTDANVGRILWGPRGPCFWENTADFGTEAQQDQLPATAIRSVAPSYVDRSAYRFDVRAGTSTKVAGCGFLSPPPGILAKMWAMSLGRLEADFQGDPGATVQGAGGGGNRGGPPIRSF